MNEDLYVSDMVADSNPRESKEFYAGLVAELLRKGAGCDVKLQVLDVDYATLSDGPSSVHKVTLTYVGEGRDPTTESEKMAMVRRDFSAAKYGRRSELRIANELFCARLMPMWLRGLGFDGLPKTLSIRKAGREAVIFQEWVGDFNLYDLCPGYSEDAAVLESDLVAAHPGGVALRQYHDVTGFDELQRLRRIRTEDRNKLFARDKVVRAHRDSRVHAVMQDPDRALRRAFGLVLDFNAKASYLWRNNPTFRSQQGVQQDVHELVGEFWATLDKINPAADSESRERILSLYGGVFLDHVLYGDGTVCHGDAIPQNICFDFDYAQSALDPRVKLTDLGHVSFIRNPLVDAVDYLIFCKNFCGMADDTATDLTMQALDTFNVSDANVLPLTEQMRVLDVLGTLTSRIRLVRQGDLAGYMRAQLSGMAYRRPAYDEMAKDFWSYGWRELDWNSDEKRDMDELADLLMENYISCPVLE